MKKPCGRKIETLEEVRMLEQYPLPVIKKDGKVMKKRYFTCNAKILCEKCRNLK